MKFDSLFRLDLKLLVALQVLLEERSASRAAQRLHLSQSAVSKLLARARLLLDDPLFIRTPRGLEPTKRAELLEPELRHTLDSIQKVISPMTFSPATDQRHFSIASLDSAYHVLLTGFFARIQSQASGVTFDYYDWQQDSVQQLINGRLDLGIMARDFYAAPTWTPSQLPEEICHHILALDKNTCLIRKGHPLLDEIKENLPWNLETYLAQSHIQVCCEGKARWLLDFHLEKSGLYRKLAIKVPSFNAAISFVEHSNLILTVPTLFARQALERYDVCSLPLPVDIDAVAYMLVWHQCSDNEPSHRWLREALVNHTNSIIST